MIYTTSCYDKDYAELKPLLERLDARCVDIRFAPAEKPVQWSKGYLGLLLKRSYQHLPALGLRETMPGRFAIQNLTLGLKVLGDDHFNIVLLCDCDNYDSCHRKTIALELGRLGKDVQEIERWK